MKPDLSLPIRVFLVFAFAAMILHPTFAAAAQSSADWIKPGATIIDSLKSGLVSIGGPLVGIGIIVIGFIAAIAQRMHWDKFGYVLLGGILITAGPSIMAKLLGLIKQ